jgi:hypothetical protein
VLLIYLVRDAHAPAGAIGAALTVGNVGFVAVALLAAPVSPRLGVGDTMQAAVALFGPAALIAIAPPGPAVYAVGGEQAATEERVALLSNDVRARGHPLPADVAQAAANAPHDLNCRLRV